MAKTPYFSLIVETVCAMYSKSLAIISLTLFAPKLTCNRQLCMLVMKYSLLFFFKCNGFNNGKMLMGEENPYVLGDKQPLLVLSISEVVICYSRESLL